MNIKERNEILIENKYFFGKHITEVEKAIGPHLVKFQNSIAKTDYVWGMMDDSVRLTCNHNGFIIDYCPARQNARDVQFFFTKNADNIAKFTLTQIEKIVGKAHKSEQLENGSAYSEWIVSSALTIVLFTKDGECERVEFKKP